MNSTLTIRLSREHRQALKQRAAALRKPESEVVRELIARETAGAFDFAQVRHLAGVVSRPRDRAESWRQGIRDRNWRP